MSTNAMYMPSSKKTLLLKNANHHLTVHGCHKPSICKKENQYLQSALKLHMPVVVQPTKLESKPILILGKFFWATL